MNKELTIIDDIIKSDGRFNPIITRAGDVNSFLPKTIDEEKMKEIVEFMPEVNRAVSAFAKKNSHTTAALMTLTMNESGPYRVLRQILAQIEKKRSALKENIYNREEKILDFKALVLELEKLTTEDLPDRIEQCKLELKQDKLASDIIDMNVYLEGALKEIGMYKDLYEQVRENNNIPEKWDEEDFEKAEVEHHIKTMFRNAVRDMLQGSCNMGTMEYMEQYGINPIVAYSIVLNYVKDVQDSIILNPEEGQDIKIPTINTHYEFLDKMYHWFKDEYFKAMGRIGISTLTQEDYLMKENK